MATQYKTVELVVLVDEDGDYAVGTDNETAAQSYTDNVTEIDGTRGMRRVVLTVTVPIPSPIELTGEVAADETEAGLTAK